MRDDIELLKYLLVEIELHPVEDSFDFACILGDMNTILFSAKNNFLKVDNLLVDLARESGNQRLILFLSSLKPTILGNFEYFWRKRQAYAFKKNFSN